MTDNVLIDGLHRTQSSYGPYGTAFSEELVAVRRLLIAEVQKTQELQAENARLREALKRHEPVEVLRAGGQDRDA
jgi:hypothetical protein